MANKNLEWGVGYSGKGYSPDLTCNNTESCYRPYDRTYISDEYVQENAVGVRLFHRKDKRPYVVIIRCPECLDEFWFDIDKSHAQNISKNRPE